MKVYGITGWKNSGKTTLVERLVAEITGRGHSVSTIKHAHHGFDVDHPGKDSFRHREAGAKQVLVASRKRWALMSEARGAPEPVLADLIASLEPVDLVLVEGYKRDRHAKIEARRAATAQDMVAEADQTIEAVASDAPLPGLDLPCFDLDDVAAIADFILERTGLTGPAPPPDAEPPVLRDDCFAMPPGVAWVPVHEALARLRDGLVPVTGIETLPVAASGGRVLAEPLTARRAHPPSSNSAVDGYGFARASLGEAPHALPLAPGRAAAGDPFQGAVPFGQAVRILTGAKIPAGVDAVIMEEDVTPGGGTIRFGGGVKPGANVRPAGEDVSEGEDIVPAGCQIGARQIALAAAAGIGEMKLRRPLRVGVLSTGDEILPPGAQVEAHQIHDANGPMLLEMVRGWQMVPVDLGHANDTAQAVSASLDGATGRVDAILTSGGASAGEEDHVSRLLRERGALETWRIAMKPGRPLALGLWGQTPVFGLPGNPVAAYVCAMIFARPALGVLAGAPWHIPRGLTLPAAFSKSKKAGRREYLRARLNDQGAVEVFTSEGSGRISGLTWAGGLVELDDPARQINPGDPVRYLPFADFD